MFINVIQERFNIFTMDLCTINEVHNPNYTLPASN